MGAFTYTLANLFILGGWVLLLVASISSPVIDKISFLNVDNSGTTSTFGVFGYCTNLASGTCSKRQLGYSLSEVASQAIGVSGYSNSSADRATKALILHPIAAGIAFLAQIIALGSHQFGFLCASLIVFLAFIVSLAAMALDFALFSLVRNAINNRATNVSSLVSSSSSSHSAHFSTAIWLVLAATACLLIATLFTLFACCCGGDRRERRHGYGSRAGVKDGYAGTEGAYVGNQPMMQTSYAPTRRHWWNVRNRY